MYVGRVCFHSRLALQIKAFGSRGGYVSNAVVGRVLPEQYAKPNNGTKAGVEKTGTTQRRFLNRVYTSSYIDRQLICVLYTILRQICVFDTILLLVLLLLAALSNNNSVQYVKYSTSSAARGLSWLSGGPTTG